MDPKKQQSGKPNSSGKNQKNIRNQHVLEALKDIGASSVKTFNKDMVGAMPQDILRQLLGRELPQRKISGDLRPGESVEMDKAYSGEQETIIKERRQLQYLNKLKDEELQLVRERSNEVKIRLNNLQQELLVLTQSTGKLAEETQIAVMSAPVEPGVYHINFIEMLIEFVKSFRRQLSDAGVWMAGSNERAQKKNYWSKFKKHKSKFLLAPDHYVTRSAG